MFQNTKSMCVQPCDECIISNMNFTYIPGDLLLGGWFEIYKLLLSIYILTITKCKYYSDKEFICPCAFTVLMNNFCNVFDLLLPLNVLDRF